MEDREKNSKKTEKKFLLFKEKSLPADKIAKAVKIGVDIVQKWIDESMRVAH